jgi:hypothetical protein
MIRFVKLLLPLLAVLAVGYAQVYGMKHGFLCEHLGQAIEIQAEHCHNVGLGPSGYTPCEKKAGEACPSNSGTQHHESVSLDLKSGATAFNNVSIPPLYAIFLSELPFFEWPAIQVKAEAEAGIKRASADPGHKNLTSAVQVAKCMVLLV